jgi:hypothetical protein
MARNPNTTWEMLNEAMSHFQIHIGAKKDRCSLTIIDLLHVSNFKGGNASITEPISSLPTKLKAYESKLKEIEEEFGIKKLQELNEDETKKLIKLCDEFCSFALAEKTKIRGLGPSYGSALLAAHFMELVPVLDRRILNGAAVKVKYDSQKQVKNISSHFSELIMTCQKELKKRNGLSLRELDKEWFAKAL